ncbi:hypothetical protein VDGL01_04197 [Verticillium dahliae]
MVLRGSTVRPLIRAQGLGACPCRGGRIQDEREVGDQGQGRIVFAMCSQYPASAESCEFARNPPRNRETELNPAIGVITKRERPEHHIVRKWNSEPVLGGIKAKLNVHVPGRRPKLSPQQWKAVLVRGGHRETAWPRAGGADSTCGRFLTSVALFTLSSKLRLSVVIF